MELDLNGYTHLPAGKVANIATFLEMKARPQLTERHLQGVSLAKINPTEFDRYMALFRAVGEPWLWFSRLTLPDDEVRALIERPGTEIFAVQRDNKDAGILELHRHSETDMELAYFGLVPEAVGGGVGHWLMNKAITRAFDHHKIKRFFVHTCTMDHPAALLFYIKSGFIPFQRAIEVADDPRLSGKVDPKFGPHHPIIR